MRNHKLEFLIVLFVCAILVGCRQKSKEPSSPSVPTVTIGHVGHDHHTALYVAMDNTATYAKEDTIEVRVVEDRKLYELFDQGEKIANIEIVRVGGGSKMPTALAQNVIDIGFGGVAPVLASVDSGAPLKLISPLHYKGDMFVVRADSHIKSWADFVTIARSTERPLRIGYKSPIAIAKLVFEAALKHEGIEFSGDASVENLQVHMVNVKGGAKLNVALAGGLVDGYVGNSPFPAIAVEKKIGRVVCDLENLPPGTFKDHPCCCIAARTDAIWQHPQVIVDLLVLFLQATQTINDDMEKAVQAAVRWTAASESVERMSIPTSGYAMEDSERWRKTMAEWVQAMNNLDVFRGGLKGMSAEKVAAVAYDLSLLEKARIKLERNSANR